VARSPDLLPMLISLLLLGIEVGILAFFIIFMVQNIGTFRRFWKRGLVIGAVLALLGLPATIFMGSCLDLSKIPGLERLPPEMHTVLLIVMAVAALAVTVLMVPLRLVYFHVAAAEWERVKPQAMPLLGGTGPAPWKAIGLGALLGLGISAISLILFAALHVQESADIKRFSAMFPGLADPKSLGSALLLGLMVAQMGAIEELIFRGGMLGVLLRLSGQRRWAVAGSVVAVSLLWALLHWQNTDAPLFKVGQIFVIGLILAQLIRKTCLEATIAAHASLNFSAVMAAYFFRGV